MENTINNNGSTYLNATANVTIGGDIHLEMSPDMLDLIKTELNAEHWSRGQREENRTALRMFDGLSDESRCAGLAHLMEVAMRLQVMQTEIEAARQPKNAAASVSDAAAKAAPTAEPVATAQPIEGKLEQLIEMFNKVNERFAKLDERLCTLELKQAGWDKI